jgi:hypothetical protein
MIGKPTIVLIKGGSILPYDIRDMRAISYDYSNRGTLRNSIPELVLAACCGLARTLDGQHSVEICML